MHAEIISIGSELTTGAKLDTNCQWLSLELGQTVGELDVAAMFPGFGGAAAAADQALCWPLLGVLMRTDERQL